jgi:hypothetical protein
VSLEMRAEMYLDDSVTLPVETEMVLCNPINVLECNFFFKKKGERLATDLTALTHAGLIILGDCS